jgi:hypothetical protein
MFLRPHQRSKDGKEHTYWSLVETVRTGNGPRQRTLCYLGELNGSAQARWLKSIAVFNEQGEAQQLKLFPAHLEVPEDDPQVARVLVNRVRLERSRQFGACFLGWELWKQLELDQFFEQTVDQDAADVPWSRVAAVLAINRLCAPGSELAVEQRWYPATALDDLLEIEEGKINDTRLYRCLDRILPYKTKLEQHLKQRYGELFGADFDVLLYDLTSTYVEGAAESNPMMARGYSRDHRPDCEQLVIALIVNREGLPVQLGNLGWQSRRCHNHGNDPAHGGAEVRQSAADLGVRSWHCKRGEPGRDPPTRRTVSGGHPAESVETVGSGADRARLETSTAGSGGEKGPHSARGGNLHSVPYGGSQGKRGGHPQPFFQQHGECLKSPAENDRARSIKGPQQDGATAGQDSGSPSLGQ